jgi:hypothetical protein
LHFRDTFSNIFDPAIGGQASDIAQGPPAPHRTDPQIDEIRFYS